MNRIPQNLFSLFLFLLSWTIMAQPTDCLTFDNFEIGTSYNADNTEPGQVIHEYDHGWLSMENFTDPDNQVWFDEINVVGDTPDGGTAPGLFINRATARITFNEVYSVVCFTTTISGAPINFGINGDVGVFESWLDPNIQEEWPDYDIVVTSTGTEPGATANICIYGGIDIIDFGGIEMLLDDICAGFESDCAFNDPNIFSLCLGNTAASISIDFSSVIGNNEFVDVYLDNEFQGFFAITAFPVVLGNVIPNGQQEEANVTICINDNPDCCYSTDIIIEDCNPVLCAFNDPNLETVCLSNSAASVSIDFSSVVGVSPFVDVYIDGEFIDFFSINNFPIVLDNVIPNNQETVSVTVCVNDDPNCCYEEVLTVQNCGTSTCAFHDPNIEAYCTLDGSTNVLVDFSTVVGNNEFVDVYVDDELYDFFPIDAFPIVLENIVHTDPTQPGVTITVCVNDNPDCCYSQAVSLPTCVDESCITFNEPEIGTTFSAETGVEAGAVIYQYPDANLIMDTYITANGALEFDQIQVVEGWAPALDPPSLYVNYATATFDYHIPVQELCFTGNLSGHAINFGINGEVAIFSSLLDPALLALFADFDISVTPVEPNSTGVVNVCISGLIEEFTIGGIEFLLDDVCSSNPVCNLSNLQVGQYSCQNNSEPYQFYLNFEHNQDLADTFGLFIDNIFQGNYAYGDLPLTGIEVQPSSPSIHFLVVDSTTDGCAEDLTVIVNSCEEACAGFEVASISLVCDDPNGPAIQIALSTPPTGQTVSLYNSSEELVATATYNDWNGVSFGFPDTVDPNGYFVVDELTGCVAPLSAIDLDPNDCLLCEVAIVSLEATDCNPNGVYSVIVDIETTAPWQQFTVTIDQDQVYGPFSSDEFPVTVGSIVGVPGESVLVQVNDLNGNCSDLETIANDCIPTCANFSASLNGVECIGTNGILVSFNLTGVVAGDPIVIYGSNGVVIEELIFSSNPVLVDFSPTSLDGYFVIVAPELDCETDLSFTIPPDCFPTCGAYAIQDVWCEGGTITVNFVAEGPEGQVFTLIVDDQTFEFEFGQNGYQIVLLSTATETYEFAFSQPMTNCETIILQDNPCFYTCDGIYDIVEVSCSNTGAIEVIFTADGPAGQLFFVELFDEIFTYEYGEEVYEFVFDPVAGSLVYELTIFDTGLGCQEVFTIENPCVNTCDAFVAELFAIDCANGELLLSFEMGGIEEGEPLRITASHLPNFVQELNYNGSFLQVALPPANVAEFSLIIEAQGINCEVEVNISVPADCFPSCGEYEILGFECDGPIQLVIFQAFGPEGEVFIVTDNAGESTQYAFGEDQYVFATGFFNNPSITLVFSQPGSVCSTTIEIDNTCLNPCEERFDVVEVTCSNTGHAIVWFTAEGPAGQVFFVEYLDQVFTFEYGQNIYELVLDNNPSALVFDLVFYDEVAGCAVLIEVENPCGVFPCEQFHVELVDVECLLPDSLLLTLNIIGTPSGEPLRITMSNLPDFVLETNLNETPIQIAVPLVPNTTGFALLVEVQGIDCEREVNVSVPADCFPVCGEYDIIGAFCAGGETVVTFVAFGPEGQAFVATINGVTYEFTFGQDQYELFIGSSNATDIEIVFGQSNTNCFTSLTIDNPCFDPCEERFGLWSVECDGNDLFIEFTADGPEGEVFFAEIHGQVFTFEYGLDIYQIGLDNVQDIAGFDLILFDPEAGCELVFNIENPCFNSCDGFFAELVGIDCSNAELFLSFELGGIDTGEPLRITASHLPNFVREINYNGESVLLTMPNTNTASFSILIEAQGIECEQEVLIELPDECLPECGEQFDVVEVFCTDNGNAGFIFTAEGPAGGTFSVRVNGVDYTFEYGQAVYELFLTNQPPPNIFTYELRFSDPVTGCVEEIVVDNPCFCFINEVQVTALECDFDGTYFIEVEFAGGTSWGNGLFLVQAGAYTQTFVEGFHQTTLGPFSAPGVDVIITEATTELCSHIEIVEPDCVPQCEIFDLVVDGTDCDANGNYSLIVDFEANIDGPFVVFNQATGESITVPLDQLPIELGPYNISEIQTSVILVYDATSNNCAADEVYVHECEPNGACAFEDVIVEAYECVDGQFMVDVAFSNNGGGPLGFYIFGDGMIFGPFEYGETFYTFGPLDGSEEEHDILLLDIADPSCFADYTLDFLCSDECNITQVIAEVTECDGEVFGVELTVEGSNLGGQFIVVGNGNTYGVFSYADVPIFLGPFEGDNETVYEFGVIDLLDPTCTDFVEVGPVNCQPCDIRDLTYEVDCGNEVYALTVDFIHENPASDGFRLFVGNEEIGSYNYAELPLTIELPYGVNGGSIRVEDFLEESCGETIDFEIPCCSLGNILNELEVGECQSNGNYYFTVNAFAGGNLGDSLVINYAPAGSSIIATEVVAYGSLPLEIGPLSGDGATSYIVVLADQDNNCGVTTTIEPVYCDNSDCVEFEGAAGVYGPLFGHPSGTVIAEENGVAISYENGQGPGCNTCNLFITDGIPNVDFGSGLIAVTQSSGMGFNFGNVASLFNTVNIDFYYPGGDFGINVNGNAAVVVDNLDDLPTDIAPGVELQVTAMSEGDGYTGMLTFSGENIESIILFSSENAAYDNVCLSLDDNVWPGDTNSDNVASHVDLLSIGLTYNYTGPARMNTAASWNGFMSPNWGGEFANGLNHKHADANGDGIVDATDEEVLAQNYGLTHGPVAPFEALPYTDLDPPVFMDLDELDELPAGTNVEIPVVAGSADIMINDIYGLAFTLELDPDLFDMNSLEVIYPTSWFGEPEINTTHLHKIYPDGRIEVALTRTDHNNVSGFGPIMYLRIIIDDIAGVHEVPTTLVVNDIMGINHDEQPLIMRPGISEVMVTSTKEGMDREELISTFGIFPNPTLDVVYFKNAYNMAPNRLDLFTAAGQHLTTVKEPGMQFDLSGYPAGVYMLQIHLEGAIFTERLVKLE